MGRVEYEDLRRGVIEAYQQGQAQAKSLSNFGMGTDPRSRWVRQDQKIGDLSPKKREKARKKSEMTTHGKAIELNTLMPRWWRLGKLDPHDVNLKRKNNSFKSSNGDTLMSVRWVTTLHFVAARKK